jgi:hypothetical protein
MADPSPAVLPRQGKHEPDGADGYIFKADGCLTAGFKGRFFASLSSFAVLREIPVHDIVMTSMTTSCKKHDVVRSCHIFQL